MAGTTAFDGIRGWFNRLTGKVFTLTIDASRTADDLIQSGRYDAVDKDVVELARRTPPGPGRYAGEFTVVRFAQPVLYRDLRNKLHGLGLRPATFRELLAYGGARVRRAKEIVVAIGDVQFDDDRTGRDIPCISDRLSCPTERWLSTCTILYSVDGYNCVLAARI